jgi:hypothetical protein
VRAEDEWDEVVERPVVGSAAPSASGDEDRPLATLWIPDPEQRRGWREFYVRKDDKPNGKRDIGFRR